MLKLKVKQHQKLSDAAISAAFDRLQLQLRVCVSSVFLTAQRDEEMTAKEKEMALRRLMLLQEEDRRKESEKHHASMQQAEYLKREIERKQQVRTQQRYGGSGVNVWALLDRAHGVVALCGSHSN